VPGVWADPVPVLDGEKQQSLAGLVPDAAVQEWLPGEYRLHAGVLPQRRESRDWRIRRDDEQRLQPLAGMGPGGRRAAEYVARDRHCPVASAVLVGGDLHHGLGPVVS